MTLLTPVSCFRGGISIKEITLLPPVSPCVPLSDLERRTPRNTRKPIMLAVSAEIEAKPEEAEEATKEMPNLLCPAPVLYDLCRSWYNFLKTRQKRDGSMKEKEKTLLDLDRVPTLNELRAFFSENDFSAAAYMDIDYEKLDAGTVEALEYIKGMMDEHWEPLSREMGLKSSSCYYGKDNPLIAMRDNMENLVAGGVLKLLEEHPERAAEILMEFAGDPNIEQNSNAFLRNAVETLMQVMNYEEAAEIIQSTPAYEDFSHEKKNNYRSKDFDRKWNHTRSGIQISSLDEMKDAVGGHFCV